MPQNFSQPFILQTNTLEIWLGPVICCYASTEELLAIEYVGRNPVLHVVL